MALGESQLGLGYPEKAIGLFTKARATFTVRLGPDHPDTLTSMDNLAAGYHAAGKLDRALPLLRGGAGADEGEARPRPPRHAHEHEQPRRGLPGAGKLDRALPLHEEVLALRKAKLGPDHPDTLTSMSNLADGLPGRRQVRTAPCRSSRRRWR